MRRRHTVGERQSCAHISSSPSLHLFLSPALSPFQNRRRGKIVKSFLLMIIRGKVKGMVGSGHAGHTRVENRAAVTHYTTLHYATLHKQSVRSMGKYHVVTI